MVSQPARTQIVCVGISHKTASVRERESFATLDNSWTSACFSGMEAISEHVLLVTCNRVEFYLAIRGNAASTVQTLLVRICDKTQWRVSELEQIVSVYHDIDAAAHLFSVVSGLESMVVGESEILGQVSRTYVKAIERRSIGPTLDALFRAAVGTGKRIRAETSIGREPASVSSVALELAEKRLGDLSQKHVTLIGLGEMGQRTLKLLRGRKLRNVALVNRTLKRAQAMVEPGWTAHALQDLRQVLADTDLAISVTGAPAPVVLADDVRSAVVNRGEQGSGAVGRSSLIIIDMAVPRDVEPEVAEVDGAILFDIDDLQQEIDQTIAKRTQVIPMVNQIVEEELAQFQRTMRELDVRPLVVELRTRAERIREKEIARTLRLLGDVDADTEAHLQAMTHALVNKLLHEPTVRIRQAARDEGSDEFVATVVNLFNLNNSSPPA